MKKKIRRIDAEANTKLRVIDPGSKEGRAALAKIDAKDDANNLAIKKREVQEDQEGKVEPLRLERCNRKTRRGIA